MGLTLSLTYIALWRGRKSERRGREREGSVKIVKRKVNIGVVVQSGQLAYTAV